MRRLYPETLNTGTDIDKYAQGLSNGIKGSYAEAGSYGDAIKGAHGVTTQFYTDPEKIDTVKPPTQAEQIQREREEGGYTGEPPPEPKEVLDPLATAATGALTSGPGQVPFRPDYAAAPPDLTKLEEAHGDAQRRMDIAQRRLAQRVNNPTPIAGGADLATLEQEFRAAQSNLQAVERELQARVAASKAKVAPAAQNAPQAGSMASATPQIITDPNAPVVRTPTEQMMQGTIDPETGTTGRQRQNYNEVTSFRALQAAEQQKALEQAARAGVVPDAGQRARLAFGMPDATPSGIIVQPDVAAPLKQQAELEQKIADDKAAQERLAQQQEIDRLKNERALAAQRQAEAKSALTQAQRVKTQGVTRAQTAADTAEERAVLAQERLTAGQQAAKKAPGPVARALENTGVATGKTAIWNPVGRTTIGGLGGYQMATGVNELARLRVEDLVKRYMAGDRSPELMQALAQATQATGQTVFGAGAMLPAMGPKTARVKGLGTAGTLGLGAYQAYKFLTEPEPPQ
jgi:hypothetical protein